ncbi:alpha-2-macroglobulin family protein [Alkalitalea saponilacus]|uniref:Uncharacterized conserved protein YfaS, alpha-2-macroglobulin family n=1 Tax=Alkalitalea saponilacus TaxID=889453 RepID=A0A1T5HKE1_9BACT|nr:MG2 domain-containing protein [Alkalitalea saponilacus]ASB47772.1 hypothetical protein CDL62_00700 [Alkalitalea saponilacus]SKC21144.1 Uncharacterized conserved protein YfaS, alpha-2-macroglobulin family [Alkalitalea saponilacus]
MHKIIFLLSITIGISVGCRTSDTIFHADFSELWHHTDSLKNLNRPQSTLEVVNEIVKQSHEQRSTEDYIKAIVLRFQLKQQVYDNALEETIAELESDLVNLWMPAKQMVHSILGDLYHQFYMQNRWRLLQQPLAETSASQLVEMSASEISRLAIHHYLSSMENREALASEPSINYDALLKGDKEKLHLRPTVYDLLANRLVEQLLSDALFELPGSGFYSFSDDFLLNHREQFICATIDEKHHSEAAVMALQILQEWLRFRMNAGDAEALADVDLLRLRLMYDKFSGIDGYRKYEQALKHLASESVGAEVYSSVLYQHATFLATQANINEFEDDERNYYGEALELIRRAIAAWPESEGALLAGNLEKEILKPSLQLLVESVVIPQKPVLYALRYKNIDTLYTGLFRLDMPDFASARFDDRQNVMKQIGEKKPLYTGKVALPDFGDFRERIAEFKFSEGEDAGYYCLVVSNEPIDHQNLTKNELFHIAPFLVSNLAYSEHVREEGLLISVVDRSNGQPVKNAGVMVYRHRTSGRNQQNKEVFFANEKGRVTLHEDEYADNTIRLVIQKDDDVFFLRDSRYFSSQSQRRISARTQFSIFTDRQIYRPGQFVHFKGVMLENRDGVVNAVANERVQVFLRDVNGQEVASQYFVTNNYGSVSGKFLLPRGTLTGSFSLGSAYGHKSFSVEEYKRPRFEVVVEPHDDIAVIGDSISLVAKANTLTGLPLNDALVNWTVTRYSYFVWRFPNVYETQIAAGTGKTDDNGVVLVKFNTDGEKKDLHGGWFRYQVEISVTDSNDETQTGSQSVLLGKNGVRANVTTKPWYLADELKEFRPQFEVRNYSGEQVKSEVLYKIEKMIVDEFVLPDRLWGDPDTLMYCDSQKFFSLEKKTEQAVDYLVINGRTDVFGLQNIAINWPQKPEPGQYRISMMVPDVSGDTLTVSSSFFVVNPNEKPYDLGEALTLVNLSNRVLKPGETASFLIGTGLESARVKLLAATEAGIVIDEEYHLNKAWQQAAFRVTEEMAGHVLIQAVLFYNNRSYSKELNLNVLKPEDQLNLELSEFKEELSPGEDNSWTLKLTDGTGQPVQTELLALMYDASLDAYQPNSLNLNVPSFHRPVSKWQWQSSSLSRIDGRMYIWHRGITQKPYPRFFWEEIIGSSHNILFMRAAGSDSQLKQGAALNIVDDSVEEIIPMTRQEEVTVPPPPAPAAPSLQLRRDLKETAFFLPHLETNSEGIARFDFKMPESLTRWRFMALAHRKDGVYATTEAFVTTVLDLMVVPNLPRIVTEGDELVFAANVLNNSSEWMEGIARLEIKDAISGEKIDLVGESASNWQVNATQSVPVSWRVKVPKRVKALEVSVSVVSGEVSDGERHIIPVRLSRTLVTETKPVMLTNSGVHTMEMAVINDTENRNFERFTFTYTQNAAWEVLSVLPWLMERPVESADQVFNRLFAASVAREVLRQHPPIERVIKAWAAELEGDEDALLSAMERNPELKSTLLTATPWLTQAQNETERRRYFAAMVRDGHLETEISEAILLLKELQLDNGAWPWFSGMRPSEQTTVNILSGLGYLHKQNIDVSDELETMVNKANQWLIEHLREMRERGHISDISISVIGKLYALSFTPDALKHQDVQFWIEKMREELPRNPVSNLSYAAVILNRSGFETKAQKFLTSVQERMIKGENQTLHFRLPHGPYWYQAPVETHVVAMEAIREMDPKSEALPGLENWLIQQKRTQSWPTTRATVSAVYALSASDRDLFAITQPDKVLVGGEELVPPKVESGTGYFNYHLHGKSINAKSTAIEIHKQSDNPSFASMHVSYFESMDRVEAGGFLDVRSYVYKRSLEDGQEEWHTVNNNTILQPGDRLMNRLVVETPQALDFVHVDAPRAANLEPVDLFSGYRYQSGLGYYMSVTDAGSSLFIDHLPKGRYTLTWEVTVSHRGEAVQGPIRVSCYYAPEFAGHSKGGTIRVH